ncbi:MAG: hypothetical protein ACC658_09885, partial [Acidimicrobiia bacterium]
VVPWVVACETGWQLPIRDSTRFGGTIRGIGDGELRTSGCCPLIFLLHFVQKEYEVVAQVVDVA